MNVKENNNLLNYVNLDNLQILTIKGPDSKIFLQNQLTINIDRLDNKKHFFNAFHCNSQGKILTNMHIFKICDNFYQYIIRKNILNEYLKSIKKYILLYKVTISLDKEKKIFGILNIKTEQLLFKIFAKKDIFLQKKTLYLFNKDILLKFKYFENYYFMILSSKNIFFIIKKYFLSKIFYLKKNSSWDKFYMKIGYYIIDMDYHCNLFLPQQFIFNEMNTIDFNKGCYLGQEIISSLNFKNKINQKLFLLKGHLKIKPSYNDILEFKNNENSEWKIIRNKIILKILKTTSNIFWIQIILKNNFIKKSLIRFQKDKNSMFFIVKIF
ncbi:hypothetical protein GJT99_00880 [Enterobacteriaceae endosymbiont of Donacia cincticornis]|uniref:CAF17-like 4Fe-4S cluster assembly/insertion protein YgfZ n=1 Tax=Enterobacteriaceae endosymbiont of Donacia cincticornis TaxID=2675773 RepID=UPI0014491FE3|nr:hypothetical protein [Enterobacteriaceae endosymbiont of Donacia cincticornis]QJC36070.1 hypothetical protein GJT99_00880 [Enterobacteriaceae endosymbiont of Donacia cincticornis]